MAAHAHSALLAGLITLSSMASSARAQNPPLVEARAHFERGLGLSESGDHRAALAEFERAYVLSSRPSLLFNIAATHQALHAYPEALEALGRYLSATEGQPSRRRSEALRAQRELHALVAHIRVRRGPPDASVTLDDRAIQGDVLTLGPGRYMFAASSPGHVSQRVEVVVASGDDRELNLTLTAEAPSPPLSPPLSLPLSPPLSLPPSPPQSPSPPPIVVLEAPSRVPFWVSVAAGGAFSLGAVATGLLAIRTHTDFVSRAENDPESDALAARGRALSISADVLGVSALAAGLGALVFGLRGARGTPPLALHFVVDPQRGAWASGTLRF